MIVDDALVDVWRCRHDDDETQREEIVLDIAKDTRPPTISVYDGEDMTIVRGDDILKNLDDGIVILANLFDQMGITPNDSSFFKLTRRYIGKDPRKVVKHFQYAKLVRF